MTATDLGNWKRQLGAARAESGEECGFNRFLDLVEAARGGGLAEAKALVGTICSEPEDNGQGEAALSILSEFPAAVQSAAVVEELVRLAGAGEDSWARSLVETEARFRPVEFIRAANGSSRETKVLAREILEAISSNATHRGAVDIAGPLIAHLTEWKE